MRSSVACRAILAVATIHLLAPSSVSAAPVPPGASLESRGYRKLTTRQGVAVYKHKDSGELAAEGLFPGGPEAVLKALLAYERHGSFNKHIAFSKVLDRGPGWLLVYQRLKLPVISNRDYTLRVTWGKRADGSRWLRFSTAAKRGPGPQRGYVRVNKHRGSWLLVSRPHGRTFARYQVSIDLGGWVPGWMARSGTKKELPKLFVGLRRLVELPPGKRSAKQ